MGAPRLESSGAAFFDEKRKAGDCFAILKSGGINWTRLRIWNDPVNREDVVDGGRVLSKAGDPVGGEVWENQALFAFHGNALPSLKVFELVASNREAPGFSLVSVEDMKAKLAAGTRLELPKSTLAVGEQAAETPTICKARTSSKPLRYCTQCRSTNVPLSYEGSAAPALLSSGGRPTHLRVAAAFMMAFE